MRIHEGHRPQQQDAVPAAGDHALRHHHRPGTELLKMNNDGTAEMNLPNGDKMNVTLDAQGMMAARQATMGGLLFAAR